MEKLRFLGHSSNLPYIIILIVSKFNLSQPYKLIEYNHGKFKIIISVRYDLFHFQPINITLYRILRCQLIKHTFVK